MPGRTRPPIAIAVLLLFAVALIAALPALSAGESLRAIQSKIESKRGKLQRVRGREQVLTGDIGALTARIRSLSREIASLRTRESRVANTLSARRAQLVRVQARYEVEHARFVALRRQLRLAQDALAARLVEIYKSDPPDVVTVILESDGFEDLLVRSDYLSKIGEQDSAIVARVRELKEQSERKRELLLTLRRQAQAAVIEIETKQRELVAARAAIEQREGALAGARDAKRRSLSGVRDVRHELEGDLAALEAASARVTAQLQGAAPAAGPIRQGSGAYIWPVNGPVVSGFGMRWGRLHAGIDIAVPAGTPIRAAASGRVALAGWTGGYGNYTCIQHGGSIATCYAHQSSIRVGVGQNVSQGQVIGAVGCTGHCFGDHLHFEVRVNGAPVDPLGYL
jgi:murein DD-endopeptidase MepM/ murein hydrolase activator NlpD